MLGGLSTVGRPSERAAAFESCQVDVVVCHGRALNRRLGEATSVEASLHAQLREEENRHKMTGQVLEAEQRRNQALEEQAAELAAAREAPPGVPADEMDAAGSTAPAQTASAAPDPGATIKTTIQMQAELVKLQVWLRGYDIDIRWEDLTHMSLQHPEQPSPALRLTPAGSPLPSAWQRSEAVNLMTAPLYGAVLQYNADTVAAF